jgi:hypothetical protein
MSDSIGDGPAGQQAGDQDFLAAEKSHGAPSIASAAGALPRNDTGAL